MLINVYLYDKINFLFMNPERKEILSDFFKEENQALYKQPSYSKFGYAFLVSGALIAYLSLSDYIGNWFLLGLAFFLLGIVLIRKKISDLFAFGDTENDEEKTVEEQLFSDVDELVLKRASELSGIDRKMLDSDTVYKIYVPIYEKIPGIDSEDILRKETKENQFIYSVWKIHILIKTEHFISYYSCVFHWLNNECINELTNEFYYSDIASVKSEIVETEFQNLHNEDRMIETVKRFVITNVSGDQIKFIIERPELKLDESFLPDVENFINQIRLSVRKKRFPEADSYSGDDVDFEIEDKRT